MTKRSPREEESHELTERLENNNKRSPRVPFQAGNKLAVPPDLMEPGYRYYWAIDKDGEIEAMRAAWYDFVLKDGQKVTVGAGSGRTHYLMRIEQQFFDEDMKKQQDEIDALERRETRINHGEYSPIGADSAVVKDRQLI